MIITLIIDTFHMHNNGTTISAMRTAGSLASRGHAVRVVACGDPDKSGPDPDTGLVMYYVPELTVPVATRLAHLQNTLFAKPVRAVLREAITGSDVVHIYQAWPLGVAAGRMAHRLGVPAVAAFHVQPENITYNIGLGWFPPAAHLIYFLLYLIFYRRFRHIHCPSTFIAAQLRSHCYRANLHVISNGVDPAFCPGPPRERRAGEPFRVLMIGRMAAEKRQDVLIRAVRRSQFKDRIQLYFAGCGPREKRLKKMGAKLPHPPVFGYYTQAELLNVIRSCDLYVHASDIEIEGISCLEAIACGLVPVISDSRRSATAQFALGPDHLFKAGSPRSLAEKIDLWLAEPEKLGEAGAEYAQFARGYSLDQCVGKLEKVFKLAAEPDGRNDYVLGRLYRFFSLVFYYLIASPLLFIWTRGVMGVKVRGERRLRGLKGALTVCNHVHLLDCALVGLALFPRKLVFPTLPENLHLLWPGIMVRLLGGVAVPGNMAELRQFFDEMEFLLVKGRIVHFFPEGELKPYDTSLRSFKRGAFHLAARARVPVVPISISFKAPRGIRKLYRKKPNMVLNIGQPIQPAAADPQKDQDIRMELAQRQMNDLIAKAASGE